MIKLDLEDGWRLVQGLRAMLKAPEGEIERATRRLYDEAQNGDYVHSGRPERRQLGFAFAHVTVVGAAEVDRIAASIGSQAMHLARGEGGGTPEVSDGSLIEQVADVLTQALARNTLHPALLRRLRDAILIPDERVKVLAEMRSFACAQCGTPLVDGEAVTVRIQEGIPSVMCAKCRTPTCQQPMSVCEHKYQFSDREQTLRYAKGCKVCQDAKKAAQGEQVEAQVADLAPAADLTPLDTPVLNPRMFQEMLEHAQRHGAQVTPPPQRPVPAGWGALTEGIPTLTNRAPRVPFGENPLRRRR